MPSIALDIGCAVGRSTFELAKRFNQVVGIDFSHGFIDACNKLKTYGKLPFTVQTEGSLVSEHMAEVDPDIVSTLFVWLVMLMCNMYLRFPLKSLGPHVCSWSYHIRII